MTTTAQATSAATRLARFAAVQRTGLAGCPYRAGATGPKAAARGAWLREYRRLRPQDLPDVDFGDAVTAAAFGDGKPVDGPGRAQPDLFAEGAS